MADKRRSQLINILQTIVMLSLIVCIALSLNFRELARMLIQADILWLIIPILIHIIAVWLNAYRWMVLLKSTSEHRIPLWRLAYSQIVGQFFNAFLPSDMGGDIYKMYDINKFYENGKSVVSVFLTRVFGFLAMGGVLAIGLIISRNIIRLETVFWIALTYSLLSIGVIALLIEKKLLALISRKNTFTKKISNRYILKIVSMFKEISAIMINRKTVLSVLFLSFIFQMLLIVIIFFYGLTAGIVLPFHNLFLIAPLIMLISALPLSVNSLGLREGAFVYFIGWMGFTNEQGMFIALLSRLVSGVIIPLIGGILFLLFHKHIDKKLCLHNAPDCMKQKR